MKLFAERFYKSSRWVKCRNAYYKYQCGICERCGELGGIVHHKIYLTPDNINDSSVSLNFDNLELICQDCHNKEHFKKNESSRYYFDKNGEVIYTE